jgi:hypothetical protein
MKKTNLLTTAAAALLLTAGAVSAQSMKKDDAPAQAPSAQQKAPAEKVAPPLQHSQRKAPETTGQAAPAEPAMKNEGMHKGATPPQHSERKTPATTGQAAPSGGGHNKTPMKSESMDKGGASTSGQAAGNHQRATTGQGAAAGAAKLSTEQRTKITTIIRRHKVAPVHLNISVRVGARVPEHVHFYPLPVEVVDIYPEWRGYDYILVGNEILVIDPGTHEIVAILEA